MRRLLTMGMVGLVLAGLLPAHANAGCGCDKPPPARAAVRPFAGHADATVTLFDDRLVAGQRYDVQFEAAADGSVDWSRGTAAVQRDLTDGQPRVHLRVGVGDVALGPCRLTVWSDGAALYTLADDQFTVVARPLQLHDHTETVDRPGYQAAVGRDGTIYIPVDVHDVDAATAFTGRAVDLPLAFRADSIAIYNSQGFLMQLLDPAAKGLFRIAPGEGARSTQLTYWRHEFASYKQAHRRLDRWASDEDTGDWHADGSRHVDHDHLLIAIRGTLPNGRVPSAGATPPFQLIVTSTPRPQL